MSGITISVKGSGYARSDGQLVNRERLCNEIETSIGSGVMNDGMKIREVLSRSSDR